jgi:DNA-binding CsgD family transcriptional regulator
MKKAAALPKLIAGFKNEEASRSNSLVFCEKSTGVAQFEAECGSDLDSNIERMASMLAMQCLVRGSDPCDYVVLVPAEQKLAGRVTDRAKQLLDAGMAAANPVPLSPRQQEILHAVARNSANKEIAAKFNITVRTVKFHVSTLLSKFGVDNRVDLARKAAGVLRSQGAINLVSEPEEPASNERRQSFGSSSVERFHSREDHNRTRNMRFVQRVLSA